MAKTILLTENFVKGLSNLYETVREIRKDVKRTIYLEIKKDHVLITECYDDENGDSSVITSLDTTMVEKQADTTNAVLFKEFLKRFV